MNVPLFVVPFFAWLVAGSLKFAVNSLRSKGLAFEQIGYGGFPSNHSSIVASVACFTGVRAGIDSLYFGLAVAFAFIVILDAASLRRHVGRQAEAINRLASAGQPRLRERIGHTRLEIAGGVAVGVLVGFVCASL
ncbi:acid phosphatase [Cupriavidus sp. UYMMa02A]|nr:acid phosphatase [Cupriavidus sp. UYMMa02A]